MQSLLQGLPLETQQTTYAQPSQLSNILAGTGGIMDLYNTIFGGSGTSGIDILASAIAGAAQPATEA